MSALQTTGALLARFGRVLAQVLATTVILLALLVGLARLLLPEVDRFRDDIQTFVAKSTGLQIDFDRLGAGVSIYGPELRLSGTTLQWPDGGVIAQVDNIAVSLDVAGLFTKRKLSPARILIKGTSLDVLLAADGVWMLQGRPWSDYVQKETGRLQDLPESLLQLEQIAFSYRDIQHDGPLFSGTINRFDAQLDDMRFTVTADIDPDTDYGRALALQGELPLALFDPSIEVAADTEWHVQLAARGFRLNKWLEIARQSDLPVTDSSGSADVRIDLLGSTPEKVAVTNLDITAFTLAQPADDPIVIDRLEGELQWRRTVEGWNAKGKVLSLQRGSRDWPESSFELEYAADKDSQQTFAAEASFLRAEDLLPIAQVLAPEALEKAGFRGSARGDFRDLDVALERTGEQLQSFRIQGEFARLGYVLAEQGIDIEGLSGRLDTDDKSGTLNLDVRDARVGLEKLFAEKLTVESLQASASWRAEAEGYRLLAENIQLVTPDGKGNAALELTLDADLANPVMDLRADVSLNTVNAIPGYLPKVIPAKVLEWLASGLRGENAAKASFVLDGPLREFPYDHGEGQFRVDVDFADASLDYAPGWPALANASGQLVFDGVSMYSTQNTLLIAGAQLQNVDVRMPDMRTGILELKGAGKAPLAGLVEFLQQSPVGETLGPAFRDVRVAGDGDVELDLKLPIRSLSKWRLRGKLTTRGATAGLAGVRQRFTDLTGTATIRNTRITATDLTATLLGEPVKISVDPIDDPQSAFSHRAFVRGRIPVSKIKEALGISDFELIAGDVAMEAQAMFPGGGGEASPFRLFLRSDLTGFSSQLPDPVNKPADSSDGLNMELQFPERGTINILGSLQRGIAWALQVSDSDAGWKLQRGTLVRGTDVPGIPALPGIGVYGAIDSLDLSAWTQAFAATRTATDAEPVPKTDSAAWYRLFREARLQIGEFYALGHRFIDVDADVEFAPASWDIKLSGPWTEGRIRVPYDFRGDQPVDLNMERLLLIEPQTGDTDADAANANDETDPRDMPAIKGKVRDFVLGNLRLGKLDVNLERTVNGLKTTQFRAIAGSFRTDMSYDWLVVDNARRSRLHVELRSMDFRDTLIKLGYSPLIEAESAALTADLLWEGGPGMGAINASTGSLDLSIRKGVVTQVETGTGRILGLLSITRVPSRLALDFKDLFNVGLPFDKISGSFRIDFGNAWTCNLGLEGPVADMAIVGRTGFVAQDYEQVAAIRPHVSNLAPVAGAFIAGPAVGITTLLLTQIFKKPLSSVGEIYYTIAGSFEDPVFSRVERSKLDTTAFADCLAELPSLSPEEIKAIEELIAVPLSAESASPEAASGISSEQR